MSVDERFFALKAPSKLEVIAKLTGAQLIGDGSGHVTGIASAASALKGELCYYEGDTNSAADISADAAGCFVSKGGAACLPDGVAGLVVSYPRYSHTLAAFALLTERGWPLGDKLISPDAEIGSTAKISPGVCISTGAIVGKNTLLGPQTVIGPGVVIGENCRIGAGVSICCALIGNNVEISSGARIGEAGFGLMASPDGMVSAPQYGRVILHDHVSIGANSCIDRGAFSDTILNENVKIDNLCHIGHNVIVGRNTVMAAFAGISGSVVIGEGGQFGGRVGIADHVTVGDDVKLGAAVGLFRDVPSGEMWSGTPARPFRQWMREQAWVSKQVKELKKK